MSRNSRNPFSKVEIGSKFVISGTAAFKHDWDYETGETHKRWYSFPLDKPTECYFVGTKTLYEGNVVGTMVYDDLTGEYLPGRSELVNRRPRWAAMFIPVSGVQYRAPMTVLVEKCAMPGCDAPVVGHTCCDWCAQFLDPVEAGKAKCRFCGKSAQRLANGTVQCGECGRNDDEPGYHDDSGDFPEPSDFEMESLESDYDAMYRIFGEVAWFELDEVIEAWEENATWKEAWEYGYLVGYENLPYRPIEYTKGVDPYAYSTNWQAPAEHGFRAGLWAGETDRKAGKPADWNIYIPF